LLKKRKRFLGFLFLNCISYKALLGIAYLRCRQYVTNQNAALTTHMLRIYFSYYSYYSVGASIVLLVGVCRLSGPVTLHGGPVVLRPVRATPCLYFVHLKC